MYVQVEHDQLIIICFFFFYYFFLIIWGEFFCIYIIASKAAYTLTFLLLYNPFLAKSSENPMIKS